MLLRTRSNNKRGTALLEFALLLPIILLFIAFIIDTGRYLNAHSNVTEASHAAARAVAQTGGEDVSGILNSIEVTTPGAESLTLNLTEQGSSCLIAKPYVTVAGTGEYPPLFGSVADAMSFGTMSFPDTWDIETAASARCEIIKR